MPRNIFKIYDGRTSFWQWDTKQKLIVLDDRITEVRFSNRDMEHSQCRTVYTDKDGLRVCNVPDVLLQLPKNLIAYACIEDDEGHNSTIKSVKFAVRQKSIPVDYICEKDEIDEVIDVRISVLEASEHTHKNKSEIDKIEDGDKAKWDAMEQNAKDYATGLNNVMHYRVKALEGMFGDGEGTVEAQIAAAIELEAANRKNDDQIIFNRVVAIENDYLKGADKTELEGKIKSNADAIKLLTDGVDVDTVDGVNDLIQYVKDHGNDVTDMRASIKNNADAIDTIEADYLKSSDKKELSDSIASLNTNVSTVKSDLNALSGRTNTVESKVDTLEDEIDAAQQAISTLQTITGGNNVQDAINVAIESLKTGELATMQGEIDDIERRLDDSHGHDNKDVLDGITSERVAAWDYAAQVITIEEIDAICGQIPDLQNNVFVDAVSGIPYELYVDNGELMMQEVEQNTYSLNNGGELNRSLSGNFMELTDVSTNEVYQLYVGDGKLHMTEVE